MKNILVLGVGGSAAANFVRSLKISGEDFHIIGTDSNKFYIKRSEADKNYFVPSCTESTYIKTLQDIVEKEKVDFIHIQNDNEIAVISENREKFGKRLFLPNKETIRICQDKFESYLHWNNAIVQPKKYFIQSVDDLDRAFHLISGEKWIREISGAGGRGSLKTNNLVEAFRWIDKRSGWGRFEISEYLSDKTVTWSSIWKDGQLIVAQGRKRLYWELSANTPSGVTGSTGGAVTISDQKLDAIAEASIFAIDKNPNGIFSVDLTYDKNGIPNPTEINSARFFTTILFFAEAGLNMPTIFLKLFFDEQIEIKKKYNPIADGYAWIRGIDFLPKLLTPEEYGALV